MILFEPKQVVEMRIFGTKTGTYSGYYNDFKKMWLDALGFSGQVPGIHVTLNPVNPALLARAHNRLERGAKNATSDTDILYRRWLPVDLDPVRPAGISSTDVEHQAAIERGRAIRAWLVEQGFPLPILANSGNGAWLLYRIDLPNDAPSLELVKKCLEVIALRFGDGQVDVDTTTANAGRLGKLYGTMTCKGDPTLDRPHRKSAILETPEPLTVVPIESLSRLAEMAPEPPPRSTRYMGSFDLAQWIQESRLPVATEGAWGQGGHKWILNPCPWNEQHTNHSAYIVQFPSGAIAAGCHHEGCKEYKWEDLRRLVEPNWEPYRANGNGQPAPHSEPKPEAIQAVPESTRKLTTDAILTIPELMDRYTQYWHKLQSSKILLGWTELDQALRGITPGEKLSLIAKTGAGKTAWVQNLLRNIAYVRRITGLFISMEQPAHQCAERWAQMSTRQTGIQIETQWGDDKRRQEIVREVQEEMGSDFILTCEETNLTLAEIEVLLDLTEKKVGRPVNFLVVDYMGMIDTHDLDRTLYGQISQLARANKKLARRREIAVCEICQVSRATGDDASTPLTIHSARESGAIEESADFLLGLYRPDLHVGDERIVIQVLKNRKGRAGMEFPYSFNRDTLEIGRTLLSGQELVEERIEL